MNNYFCSFLENIVALTKNIGTSSAATKIISKPIMSCTNKLLKILENFLFKTITSFLIETFVILKNNSNKNWLHGKPPPHKQFFTAFDKQTQRLLAKTICNWRFAMDSSVFLHHKLFLDETFKINGNKCNTKKQERTFE